MKVLNLYAGIGGNRKLWTDVEVTAVELDFEISQIYNKFFPQDEIINMDAHEYLLKHFKEFDFIWTSPPCPTHSRINIGVMGVDSKFSSGNPFKYPDMKLYEEIILLKHHFKGRYVVENVISYYEPLIPPQEVDNHFFWCNFHIPSFLKGTRGHYSGVKELQEIKGFDLSNFHGIDKIKILRNCVNPYLGKHIFDSQHGQLHQELFT